MARVRQLRGKSRVRLVLALLAPFSALAVGVAGAAGASAPDVGIGDVLRNYEASLSEAPDDYVARLSGEVRSLLGRHTFTGTVTSSERRVSTKTAGTPWYLPENFSGDLVDISGELERFDLSLKGVEDGASPAGGRLYHVSGKRKPGTTTNAQSGEFWLRESDWRMVRCAVEYGWGAVDVTFTYAQVGDYVMLSGMDARVHPFGVTLNVVYDDYRFGPA